MKRLLLLGLLAVSATAYAQVETQIAPPPNAERLVGPTCSSELYTTGVANFARFNLPMGMYYLKVVTKREQAADTIGKDERVYVLYNGIPVMLTRDISDASDRQEEWLPYLHMPYRLVAVAGPLERVEFVCVSVYRQ